MAEHLWQVQISQPDSTGFILLDAQGYVLKTNLKGQEYLALFGEAGVGQSVTHLGQQSLQELTDVSTTLSVEMRYEFMRAEMSGELFEVRIQPVAVGYQRDGWLLMIREVAQGEERSPFGKPPGRSVVFQWPPASPLTSNLP